MSWTIPQKWAEDYFQVCREAVQSEEAFKHFRSDPRFRVVLEHVTKDLGAEYRRITLQRFPEMELWLKIIAAVEEVGGPPELYDYGDGVSLSPTTWRYLKVVSDLRQLFPDLLEPNMVEIGGGYGGQCRVISMMLGFKSYTLLDAQEPVDLQRKYLSHILDGLDQHCVVCTTLDKVGSVDYDLVISNYAFCEFSEELMHEYAQRVISRSKRGYITVSNSRHQPAASAEEFFPSGWRRLEEKPLTSTQGNYIAVWGSDRNLD